MSPKDAKRHLCIRIEYCSRTVFHFKTKPFIEGDRGWEARLGRTLHEAPKGSRRGGAAPERGSSERRRLVALALIHGGRRRGCTAEFGGRLQDCRFVRPLLVCAGWRRVSAVSVPPEMCSRAQVVVAPCWRGLWMPTCFRFHSSSLHCLLARGHSRC